MGNLPLDLISFCYDGGYRPSRLLGEERIKMSPIQYRIRELKSNIENITELEFKYRYKLDIPSGAESFRINLLKKLEFEKNVNTKEIETLSVILSELNTEKIKSMENEMKPPAVRLKLLDEVIDGEEQFEAFIFDQVVERGNFEKCQRTLRANSEFVTRGSIYSKNKVDSSEVTR
ncbi:hypothetical protein [Leptospira bouyouniensis]|nr:hypothetical protein [Leptospira bouyouniensis]